MSERLIATFRPQEWRGDYAYPVEGEKDFDVTEKFLSLSNDEIRNFRENDYDSDHLADDLPERQEHDGPFEVDTNIDEWLEELGYPPRAGLTDVQIEELRQKFGVKS